MNRIAPLNRTAYALAMLACSSAVFAQAPNLADPRVIINRLSPDYRQFNAVGIVYPIAKTDGLVVMSK